MKNEYPIIFSTPMVQAIQEGRKTQTRRIVTNKTALEWLEPEMFSPEFVANPENRLCRYGAPGGKLWVRETWCLETTTVSDYEGGWREEPVGYLYRADFGPEPVAWNWKPSIHMPRAASRLLLEITDIRVQRLQEITEEDARSEGPAPLFNESAYSSCETAKESFRTLWQSIHGNQSWTDNPWVWAITFKEL